MESATEAKIMRTVDFDGDEREAALKEAVFLQERVDEYVAASFGSRHHYQVNKTQASPGNTLTSIRRGSGEIIIETNFGQNTRYGPGGAHKYYCTYVEVSHKNHALDQAVKTTETVKWCLQASFGVLGALIFFTLIQLTGAVAQAKRAMGIGMVFVIMSCAAIGGFAGTLVGRWYYRLRYRSQENSGEIDELEDDWANMQETIEIIFDKSQGFNFDHARGANHYE